MPGKRGPEFGDFVTPFAEYRILVDAADSVGVEDPAIPVLDTRGGPNANVVGQGSDENQYGRNAQLLLAAIIEGFTAVAVELWLDAEPTRAKLRSPEASSSSSSSGGPTTGFWVKVAAKTFSSVSELWIVKDIPPGRYKVKITSVTGTGTVSLIEGHAA